MKFTDNDRYGVPLCCASLLANAHEEQVRDGAAGSRPLFGPQGLKAKEIEMALTSA
jgi:hypothetical protein